MEDTKIYEIGYLLTPLMPAEKVEESMDAIYRDVIEAAGGQVLLKTAPKLRPLAYPVSKSINNKKSIFNDAYFGAVKFQAVPAAINGIKDFFDKNDDVIRFLVIVAPKQDERVVARRPYMRKPVATEPAPKAVEEEKGIEMTEQEIDQEIDSLLDSANA